MGHHGHGGHGLTHEEEERIHQLMYEDHRAVVEKVEVAVARVASPVWRVLAAFGIYRS